MPEPIVADNLPVNLMGSGNMTEKGLVPCSSLVSKSFVPDWVAASKRVVVPGLLGSAAASMYPYTPRRCAPCTSQKSLVEAVMVKIRPINKSIQQGLLRHFDIHNRTKVATWLGGKI